MDTLFQKIKQEALIWQENWYKNDEFPAIAEILWYSRQSPDEGEALWKLRFLREPQFEALVVYWYLRIELKTPSFIELYRHFYPKKKDFREILGIWENPEITEMIEEEIDYLERIKTDFDFVKKYWLDGLHESLNLDYPSYILALTMGAWKTMLIATIVATEFAMSFEYPEANFMKNALVFAPGTTILESLKEISDTPFEKILPPHILKKFLANLKLVYPRTGEKEIQVTEWSNYNLIVTNTEKIKLKKASKKEGQSTLDFEEKEFQNEVEANLRLQKIASLSNLWIFSDEAHHTYGQDVGKDLKRVRETINYIHREANLVCVVNTTGTPYIGKEIIKDVIYWYGLDEGIQDGILKWLTDNIKNYHIESEWEDIVINDIITDFFWKYDNVTLPNGAKAKIAFYFKTEDHLTECRALIEKSLATIGKNPTLILKNTQKSSTEDIREFNALNDPKAEKRIILLVGKGTEWWNCPSLFATALIREVWSSNNFVLQASTRCLRQVKWNNHLASIYLDSKNLRTLNSELEANFRIDVTTLKNTSVIKEEAILKIHKPTPPILEITRIKKRIVRKWEGKNSYELVKENIQKNAIYRDVYTLNFSKKWEMLEVLPWVEIVETIDSISLYSILAPIAQNYHISYLELKKQIEKAFGENLSLDHISVIAKQIESQMSGYETIEELVTQALAIIKIKDEQWNDVFEKDEKGVYFHTIQFTRGKYKENDSVHTKLVWKESIVSNPNNIWFHFSPYNFDSEPEKDFFLFMLTELQIRTDDIDDIYFTGSLTDKRKTDMHFEYKWKDKAWHNYFPDFVIVKKNGEYLIVEIKSRSESNDPDVIEKARIVKRLEDIDTNKFKYMVLYADSDIIALSEKMKALDVLKFSK